MGVGLIPNELRVRGTLFPFCDDTPSFPIPKTGPWGCCQKRQRAGTACVFLPLLSRPLFFCCCVFYMFVYIKFIAWRGNGFDQPGLMGGQWPRSITGKW